MTNHAAEPPHVAALRQQAEAARARAQTAEQAGRLDEAITAYRELAALCPAMFQVHNNLASLLLASRRPAEALAAAESALALNRDDALVNANAGQALHQLGRAADALPFLEAALRARPDLDRLRLPLADALLGAGRDDEAVAALRTAEARLPQDIALLDDVARLYARARRGEDAERIYLRMLRVAPGRAATFNDIAQLYRDFAQFSRAREMAERGLALEPRAAVLWNTLANAQASIGRMNDAIASYRKVIELEPGLAAAHSNLLLALHYPSEISPQEILDEHRRWARRHAPAERATRHFANLPDPGRRLRIGYMSPDIRAHSVAFFLEPLLDHHDRCRFEICAYADVRAPDEVTRRLRGKFDHYRSIEGLRDADVAAAIRDDHVDILVDLAGHAGNIHAAALAYKPAPVVVTYCGYPDTTGIAAVDYRLTDWIADPAGSEAGYVETLVRLPAGFLCFGPPADLPAVAPPPAAAGHGVTFGSFNREFKVSQQSLDLWCRTLAAVPGSRIVMKSVAGADPATRVHLLGEFARRGIAPDRVRLLGFVPEQSGHLASYGEVDIALDTHPYNGTTTTLDALLMGVPVVTLAGRHHAGRVGASLLTRVGLAELIAAGGDEYVSLAAALAGDLARLARLRRTLRHQLLASPLCDGTAFTAQYEQALLGMWCHWCRSQGATLGPADIALAARVHPADSAP